MKEDDTHKDSEILDDLFVFYKQREEYLVHLFPDLCPAFPKDQAWQIGEAVGAFEEAVERLFQLSSADRGRLPGRVDDAARGDRERWSTMSTTDMIANFNGNSAYFEDTSGQNHTEGYKKASILALQAVFRYHSVAEIANSFSEAGDSFIPAYRNLKMMKEEGPRTRRTPWRDAKYPTTSTW